MPAKRLYVDTPLTEGQTLVLDSDSAHYLGRVLRGRSGDSVYLFNGTGDEYTSAIETLSKRAVTLQVQKRHAGLPEPDTRITLSLALSRNEKMDLAVQKAVELGVTVFQPIVVTRSVMQLEPARVNKRMAHWQAVVVSATQQCGRSALMQLAHPTALSEYLSAPSSDSLRLLAHPDASNSLPTLLTDTEVQRNVEIMIGPEGGFTDEEVAQAEAAGYLSINAGPRVLRTETAAIALVAALQCAIGDWR